MSRRVPPVVRAASRLALRWAGWYTRDLEPAIAGGRRDEIASDVWEQAAGQADRRAAALAASITARTVRGIPADLAWRWRMPSAVPSRSRVPRLALGLAVVLAGAALALGVTALVHVGAGLALGQPLPSVVTVVSTVAGVTALALGLALVARSRTRRIGLLWLGAGLGVVLHFATLILVTLSPVVQPSYYGLLNYVGESWLPGWFAIVAALAAFPALVALTVVPTVSEETR